MMRRTASLLTVVFVLLAPLACGTPEEHPDPVAPDDTTAAPTSASGSLISTEDLGVAPDFTLPTLQGDSLSLSDLRGDLILLNFWATWCTPCLAEMPDLQALHEELNPHGFHVLGVAIEESGKEMVIPFAENLGITYPIVVDEGRVAEDYGGVFALPTTYLIDREGQIRQRVIGIYPTEEMRPQLRDMLNAPADTTSLSAL